MTRPALICDAAAVAQAARLVICAPGALTRIDIFDPILAWRAKGWEPVFYPFPGLDGRPLSPALDIAQAADQIAEFTGRHGDKRICFLGFSTGGSIVIEAASRAGAEVKTAAIAPGLPRAGGLRTMAATTRDILAAALRVRSVAVRPVWLDYYRTLLVGRAGLRDAVRSAQSREITAARTPDMVYPQGGLLRAHARGLQRWKGPQRPVPVPRDLSLFVGTADPVFAPGQTDAFAATLGDVRMRRYPGHGHMLFLTHPGVFDDVLAFFEQDAPIGSERAGLSD